MPATLLYLLIKARSPLRMRLLRAPPSSGQTLADYDAIRLPDLPDASCVYDEGSYIDAGNYVNILVSSSWDMPDFSKHYYPLGCIVYTADTQQIVATATAFAEGVTLPDADGGSTITLALLGMTT